MSRIDPSLVAKLTFDHADIVSAVSYGQSDGLLMLLDELHHLGFLQWGDPAADHRFARTSRRQKLFLHVWFQGVSLKEDGEEESTFESALEY